MKKGMQKIFRMISIGKLYLKRDSTRSLLRKKSDYLKLICIEHQLFKLYQNISGYHISKQEREKLTVDEDAFIYGEIEFLPFFSLLQKATPSKGEIFYDLGSGIGRAVFTAAFYFDFAKTCGIEVLSGLHNIAENQIKTAALINNHSTHIQFININFLHYDFLEANIIFVNATCFSYSTWEKLLTKFSLLKSGSRIIVTTKKIFLDCFQLLYQNFIPMNNSISFVSIYLKK